MSEEEFLSNIKNNQGIIIKLVNLYANDIEERKDLYQEIMYQGWKNAGTFKSASKFSTWLYRLCLNTILTNKRKRRMVDYNSDLEQAGTAVNPAEKYDRAEQLYSCIKTLDQSDRGIITMHLDGYNNEEIAGVIGITVPHLAVKLHRIKKELALVLKRDLYG